jgi:hypothetical protein
MFPFARYVHLFPASLQWVPWPLLTEPCGSPPSQVLWVRKTAPPSVNRRLRSLLETALLAETFLPLFLSRVRATTLAAVKLK